MSQTFDITRSGSLRETTAAPQEYALVEVGPGPDDVSAAQRMERMERTWNFQHGSLHQTSKNTGHTGHTLSLTINMGVSINGDTPVAGWFIRENPIKMDDDWGTPILGNLHMFLIDGTLFFQRWSQ